MVTEDTALDIGPPEPTEALASVPDGKRWHNPADIRAVLDTAARAADPIIVRFMYEDAEGNRMLRKVTPTQVEDRRAGVGFQKGYLIGYDHDRDDPRTFLIDRIEWVEKG